jgi:C-terminal processing protease CtpA/Prc
VVRLQNRVTPAVFIKAKYTTMAFQTSPDITVIGSITAGADGNVFPIYLPGGIYTFISGIGVFYPDGSQTQRKGIKIDITVRPTIEGIIQGRDELLDKAIEIINSKK